MTGIVDILDWLWQSGTTQFLDASGRPIIYGTHDADTLTAADASDNPYFSTLLQSDPTLGVAIIGGDEGDELTGGSNDDLLMGGAGADSIIGGEGWDIVDYKDSDAAVVIDLSASTQSGGHAEGDVLAGVEEISGSRFDDVLVGDENANALSGAEGNDYIIGGGGGFDALYDGDGADVLEAHPDTEWNEFHLTDDDDMDLLIVGEGLTIIDGGGASDRIVIRPDLLGIAPGFEDWDSPATGVAGSTQAIALLGGFITSSSSDPFVQAKYVYAAQEIVQRGPFYAPEDPTPRYWSEAVESDTVYWSDYVNVDMYEDEVSSYRYTSGLFSIEYFMMPNEDNITSTLFIDVKHWISGNLEWAEVQISDFEEGDYGIIFEEMNVFNGPTNGPTNEIRYYGNASHVAYINNGGSYVSVPERLQDGEQLRGFNDMMAA